MSNLKRCSVVTVLVVMLLPTHAESQTLTRTYPPLVKPWISHFGPWVLHHPGWDRYLMYVSINSAVGYNAGLNDDYPSNTVPGKVGTYNNACPGWWADRIWLTWHFGDGVSPAGWDEVAGNDEPPFLMLSPGGAGQDALIGDPTVVFWQDQWHMYYEGTSRCDGYENLIFHATSPSWFGPWTKQGLALGLWGMGAGQPGSVGLQWPTAYVDVNNNLILYFSDSHAQILAAQAYDATGNNFFMLNWSGAPPSLGDPAPVTSSPGHRGAICKDGNTYKLVKEDFVPGPPAPIAATKIQITSSNNYLSFPTAPTTLFNKSSAPWNADEVGLPMCLINSTDEQVYFTARTGLDRTIGVYKGNLP